MKNFIIYFLIFIPNFCFSQTEIEDYFFKKNFFENDDFLYSLQQREIGNGNITVFENSRIDSLLKKKISIDKENQKINGFRIQIYFESGRDAQNIAEEIEIEFSEKYPYISSYLIYNAPFFKIRVGDFRTKNEAMKILREIKIDFKSSFIVKDKINFPELENIF